MQPEANLDFLKGNNNIRQMFSKKKHNNSLSPSSPNTQQPRTSPLPRLQQLTQLETQLISILGSRNVNVDSGADIFTRLEEIYLGSLQAAPLGRELLEKCLRVLGDCDSPARVRFLYLCAHEMRLGAAAADELEPVLLDAFHCTLALKNKVDLGFKAALAFCQISGHAGEVDKTLSNLVVALEQELDYHPHAKQKIRKQNASPSNTYSDTKAIYLGSKLTHKHKDHSTQHLYGRLQKLSLYRLLYQAFVTGEWRVQSEAKRKYYYDCREDLRGRMLREYPGREIQKKLNHIDEERFVTLAELGTLIVSSNGQDSAAETCTPNVSITNSPNIRSASKLNNRSKSQFSSSIGFQSSLKTSFVRDQFGSTWGATLTPTPLPSHSRKPSFKLHIKRTSKHKILSKITTQEQQLPPQQEETYPEVSKLVFRQNITNSKASSSHNSQSITSKSKKNLERKPSVHIEKKSSLHLDGKSSIKGTKGLVLKFDRLQKEKPEVKKKKLQHNFNWQRGQKENNQLQHVFDIQCIPEIQDESSPHSTVPPCSIHPKLNLQHLPQPHPEPQRNYTNPPSVTELNSARIDQLLKEGVEWISGLDSQNPHHSPKANNAPVISNTNLEKQECSFSDTQNINESRVDLLLSPPKAKEEVPIEEMEIPEEPELPEEKELSRQASYKIVIRRLEKPEVYLIISQEVQTYLTTLRKAVIDHQMIKQAERIFRRHSAPERQPPIPEPIQTDASLEVKRDTSNDSDCQRIYLASQTAFQNMKGDTSKQEDACLEEEEDEGLQEIILPSGIIEFPPSEEVEEQVKMEDLETSRQVIICQPKITQADIGQLTQIWLSVIYDSISATIADQIKEDYPCSQEGHSSQRSLPVLPLSRLKCSIKAENPSSSSSSGRRRPSSPIHNKKFDAEVASVPGKDLLMLDIPPFQRSRQLIQGFRGQLFVPQEASHFTCSRFAGSKIDTQKESDGEWRSQMNFMNQIFKNDRNDQVLPLLQIPESNGRRSREDFDGEESQSRYRSRSQSEISRTSSGGIARQPSISNRSQNRQKTHVCLSFSYNDSYDATMHSKRFTHWLAPQLKVSHNKITLTLHPQKGQMMRETQVPAFVAVNDDTVREVSGKVQIFLSGLPPKEDMTSAKWQQLRKELEETDLLPDQVDLKPFLLPSSEAPEDEIRCSANLKTHKITLTSSSPALKINPIIAVSLQELEAIVSSLDATKFYPNQTQILIRGVWCLAGQRSIKMRQKFEGVINHYTFDVLQKFTENDRFDYCVREQSGESLTFEGIEMTRRPKILKNMDTIIGFCLKTVNGKMKLIPFTTVRNPRK